MYGNKISKILKSDKYAKNSFLGVFSIDMLPDIKSLPASGVINTDPSYLPGSHWIAFYIDHHNVCNFFDSYGNHPKQYRLDLYFKKCTKLNYNNFKLQSVNSEVCGHYCIYFIIAMSRGYDLCSIIDVFSKKNFKFNDFIVENLINMNVG